MRPASSQVASGLLSVLRAQGLFIDVLFVLSHSCWVELHIIQPVPSRPGALLSRDHRTITASWVGYWSNDLGPLTPAKPKQEVRQHFRIRVHYNLSLSPFPRTLLPSSLLPPNVLIHFGRLRQGSCTEAKRAVGKQTVPLPFNQEKTRTGYTHTQHARQTGIEIPRDRITHTSDSPLPTGRENPL